jgi:peroxiredoxin
VVKAFNEYKDKNFTIVGISLDKDKSKWMKAIADDNLAWTHLSDLKYWDSEIPALYGVRGIPANVLLDPDGVIVAKNITGEDLHKKLKEVIK